MRVRSSPSGPLLDELYELEPSVHVDNYLATGPLVFVVLPAGHAPGFYCVAFTAIVRVAASAGNFTRAIFFDAPGLGPTSFTFTNVVLTALGNPAGNFTSVSIFSTGNQPIQIGIQPNAIVGAPRLDITAQALLLGQ